MRRPRPTTVCTACRDRRIKCDREKPTCSECKRQERLCERPKRPNISDLIVLDARVDKSKSIQDFDATGINHQDLNVSQPQDTNRPQSSSVLPFWALAKGNREIESNFPWVQGVVTPRNCTQGALLDDEILTGFTNCIPPSKQCALLLQSFLLNVHLLVPLGVNHVVIQDILASSPTSFSGCSPQLLSLVLAVLYSGAITSPTIITFEQMEFMHSVYEKLSQVVYTSAIYETSSTLQFLQGYLTLNTVRASRYDPIAGYDFVLSAIRLAQSTKLHVIKESDDSLQADIGRRVWWYLIFIDVEMTLASGIPGMIHPDEYSTTMPSATCGTSYSDNHVEDFEDCLQHSSSMRMAMHGRFRLAQNLQIWMKSTPSKEKIIQFTQSIDTAVRDIPLHLEWPRLYLSLQSDRVWCILQPELSTSTSSCEDPTVKSARSFLEKYHRLATLPSRPNYQWYIPGQLHPLHALMIVLMHLHSCQQLDVELILSRDLVNKIFALRVLRDVGDTTIVARAILRKDEKPKVGSPMYCLLWDLRRRTWEKAGWDIPRGEEFPFRSDEDIQLGL